MLILTSLLPLLTDLYILYNSAVHTIYIYPLVFLFVLYVYSVQDPWVHCVTTVKFLLYVDMT